MVSRSKRIFWSREVRTKARKLRKSGLSYGDISRGLGVAKSTLYQWIHDLKWPRYITEKERLAHLSRIRILAANVHKQRRKERLEQIQKVVAKEVSQYPISNLDYLRSLLAVLYWAEGSKGRGTVFFANSDPKLSLLFLTLLRKSYPLDEAKLRVRLYLHWYHPIKKTRKFWSTLLGVPESRFGKIYIKKRSITKRFRKNFAGICFIKYHSEHLRAEILERARAIADRFVPVAQLD